MRHNQGLPMRAQGRQNKLQSPRNRQLLPQEKEQSDYEKKKSNKYDLYNVHGNDYVRLWCKEPYELKGRSAADYCGTGEGGSTGRRTGADTGYSIQCRN